MLNRETWWDRVFDLSGRYSARIRGDRTIIVDNYGSSVWNVKTDDYLDHLTKLDKSEAIKV